MKFGLVSHFKVNHAIPKKWLISNPELVNWFVEYDKVDIEMVETDLQYDWSYCCTGPANRAGGELACVIHTRS